MQGRMSKAIVEEVRKLSGNGSPKHSSSPRPAPKKGTKNQVETAQDSPKKTSKSKSSKLPTERDREGQREAERRSNRSRPTAAAAKKQAGSPTRKKRASHD